MYNAILPNVLDIKQRYETLPPSYAEAMSDAPRRRITHSGDSLHLGRMSPVCTSGRHTFLTSYSSKPTRVNSNVSPSLSALAAHQPAKPFVNEQNRCFWLACVAVFTDIVASGPFRV